MTTAPCHARAPLLALSAGDPNGIGPEVLLRAAFAEGGGPDRPRLVAVGPSGVLRAEAEALGLGPLVDVPALAREAVAAAVAAAPGALPVFDPVPGAPFARTPGRPTAEGGAAAMRAVAAGADACLAGQADGLVTAPLSKEAIHRAGFDFPGHTEFLAARTGAAHVVMMLAAELPAGPLRVALVTIHEPLARVAPLVTAARVAETVRTLTRALRDDFGLAAPRLAVLGLNPHAGDGGVLGHEEQDVIAPALEALGAEGYAVTGPHPADAFFGRGAWRAADAVVAMYHDQGLAPFKALAMGGGVNVTCGLPIVRTSPDHGTGFDIAGQGRAEASSMAEAIRVAARMAAARARPPGAATDPSDAPTDPSDAPTDPSDAPTA
ncbi:MAG: 4-hydroxythreonine-4-phosphate dehydrogenase PdxA [Rubricoccaceae bacterium]